ncbi:MAG: hypothetical protein AMXMBFR34_11910 [Myxococcaceae bacterium]
MEPNPTPSAPRRRSSWPLALLVLLVAGAAGYFAVSALLPPRVPVETPPPVVDAGVAAAVDAGPVLPPIEDGDVLLKKLARDWSTDPLFGKWLDAASLRHLVAAVQAVADGESPRESLPFVSLAGRFSVREEAPPAPNKKKKPAKKKNKAPPPPGETRQYIAPESYARYDVPTKALTSVPAATAGAAYGQVRPFLDAAFAEMGRPGKRFDDVFTAALQRMLAVKVPAGEVEVVPKGLAYAFKDETLEGLKPAEKHLVRMGPQNGRAVQAWLRAFGESAKLLPPP